jgi:hypothetical protein
VVFREQLIIVQRDPAQRDPYRMIGRLLAVDGWGDNGNLLRDRGIWRKD